MASRYIRNTVILAKPEATVGTDPTPTGADNAILVSDMTITPLEAQNIQRNNILGYFGGQEELVGPASVRCSFTCELAGSGTASAAPKWGNLLLGCAMAEATLATPDRVEYTPVSSSLKTLTLYWYDDGVLHKVHGAMGNCTLTARVGEKPMLRFEFVGTYGGISATANATPTLTGWKKPLAVIKDNVVDITLGCTYSAGALASGTVYPSNGIEIAFGNAVSFTPLLSSETVDITNRDMTGSTDLELTAAQEVTFMTTVRNNTTQGLGFTIGTAAGSKIIIHAPAVQLLNPRKVDLNGKRLIGYDLRVIPSSGNDELRIACV